MGRWWIVGGYEISLWWGLLHHQEIILHGPGIQHSLGRDTEPFPGLLDAVGVEFDPDGVPA